MANGSMIGSSVSIRGRITGEGDLEIAGRVEGDVNVKGELVISETGMVGGNLSAKRVIVRGAVKGDITASESILLDDGARVVGDIRAARIGITEGALVRGLVETGSESTSRVESRGTQRRTPEPVRVATPAKAVAAPAPVKAKLPSFGKPAAKVPAKPFGKAAAKAPPAVVPVLKKGAKASLQKRSR